MGVLHDGGKNSHRRVSPFSLRGGFSSSSPLLRIIPIPPRLLLRYALVAFLVCAVAFIHLHGDAVRELRAKYSPTHFGTSSDDAIAHQLATYDWRPFEGAGGATIDRPVLEERGLWKQLGAGFEGKTFMINDTVIKTFTTSRSPLRNCVPAPQQHDDDAAGLENMSSSAALHDPSMRWPSEIPAGLVLGGLSDKVSDTDDFVPVKDFFYTPATNWMSAKWHLLSPLMKGGNLIHLAKRLSSHGNLYSLSGNAADPPSALSYRELDALFRPSLDRLLAGLERMHAVQTPTSSSALAAGGAYNGAICHDDIKLSNIFVANYSSEHEGPAAADSHWLLADLGYVREVTHPYHATYTWLTHLTIPPSAAALGRQGRLDDGSGGGIFYGSADCRINDVMLLLKTYIRFLRLAAVPPEDKIEGSPLDASEQRVESRRRRKAFDEAFWAGSEPWSQLYWSVVSERPLTPGSESAGTTRDRSVKSFPPAELYGSTTTGGDNKNAVAAYMLSRKNGGAGIIGRSNMNNENKEYNVNDINPAAAVAAGLPEGGCWFRGRASCLARATETEMERGMSNIETKTRLLAGAYIFGVPTAECDA